MDTKVLGKLWLRLWKIEQNESASAGSVEGLNALNTKIKASALEHSPSPEVAIQRQDLVDNLITMGFPLEWCVRVANVQQTPVMDESAAIAWIIERMEDENASHDGFEAGEQMSSNSINENVDLSQRNVGSSYNAIGSSTLTSEDDDDNDEDDSLQEISDEKPMLGAKSPLLCNNNDIRNTTNYEDHAHLLDDEECTEMYAPLSDQYFPSLTAPNVFSSTSSIATGLEVSANPINHGSADVSSNSGSLMSLLNGTISTFGNNTEYQASSDAYSAQAILPKVISLFSHPEGDVDNISTSNKNSRVAKASAGSLLHELGNSDDQQELWALSLATSCALSTIYARSSVVSILQHVRDEHTGGSDEMYVKSDLGLSCGALSAYSCLLTSLKLVRFRGPLPHTLLPVARPDHHLYFADELHFLLKPIFKILLSSSEAPGKREDAHSAAPQASKQSPNSPLFLTVLVDEALGHFTRARARQYDKMAWIARPIPHLHPFASSIITLTCDNDSLVQPNPIWAAWTLNIIMDEMESIDTTRSGQNVAHSHNIDSV